mmetsp:Transcript_20484/g.68483  ORF Transcript_20484/g.68483 Transcript_20484/m.68483 type:complete len:175 (+) Transcript_20484:1529-2053(+)
MLAGSHLRTSSLKSRSSIRARPTRKFNSSRFLPSPLLLLMCTKVPEIPQPSARARKVRVGSEKSQIYSFSPVITRATFAELRVNISLGDWNKRCQVPLSTQEQMLSDIRTIVESHCFGKELSGARFISCTLRDAICKSLRSSQQTGKSLRKERRGRYEFSLSDRASGCGAGSVE